MRYYFYARSDSRQEAISWTWSLSRLDAAKKFAQIKRLELKTFLKVYAVSR